ncbi:hypothetical protein AX15_003661 [Amanita polypyramis BW_CC]|nr:hypothetical protein AX15_003661 [Amanita polypyramis BW_CC]
MLTGSPAPWTYIFIRLLFKFVLKIFYGNIVVENPHLIPETGKPCIVCANHSNSLTDALLLVSSIPSKRRNMLRLTAKSTQFGRKTFTSRLIESAGTVPIKRRKDFDEGTIDNVDNTDVMKKLMEVLEMGDAICLFPEGLSRYHPTIAPLKTGVARLVADVLSRNRDNQEFEISILNCSITYMHRQHFRSDVLVTFHPPMTFRPKDHPELLEPVEFSNIRTLTSQMHQIISSGTIDSPTWDLVRTAKLAARIYVPLGTYMTLGDHVRVIRAFLETFKTIGTNTCVSGIVEFDDVAQVRQEIAQLRDDLKIYQDQLAQWGIKDDRIRRPLTRRTIILRLFIRFIWSLVLFTISLPGLILWLPIFITTFIAVHNFTKTGPIFDTYDEIAQYKLTYGLVSGLCVWLSTTAIAWEYSVALTGAISIPALMWITLRWFEDAVSSFRAFTSLLRLLYVGKMALKTAHERRQGLHSRVMKLATETLGLPKDPEKYFTAAGGREKGRVRGHWESGTQYFSIKRRRKRDWNETLRLYDKVDYPKDD